MMQRTIILVLALVGCVGAMKVKETESNLAADAQVALAGLHTLFEEACKGKTVTAEAPCQITKTEFQTAYVNAVNQNIDDWMNYNMKSSGVDCNGASDEQRTQAHDNVKKNTEKQADAIFDFLNKNKDANLDIVALETGCASATEQKDTNLEKQTAEMFKWLCSDCSKDKNDIKLKDLFGGKGMQKMADWKASGFACGLQEKRVGVSDLFDASKGCAASKKWQEVGSGKATVKDAMKAHMEAVKDAMKQGAKAIQNMLGKKDSTETSE